MRKRNGHGLLPGRRAWPLCLSLVLLAGEAVPLRAQEQESPGVYTSSVVEEQGGEYVTVEYPQVTGVENYDALALEQINEMFQGTAREYLASEQAAMEEVVEELAEYGSQDMISYVGSELRCKELYLDEDLFSVAQYCYSYTGGAHGYGYTIGTSFNLKTGEELTMGGLLGCSEEEAQEAVVAAYRKTIIGQVEMVTEESIRDSFDSMAYWMTAEGMKVSIPPYVVASYAAGPQEVVVTPDLVGAAPTPTPVPDAAGTVTVIGGIEANASDFIFPYSGERLLTEQDLAVLEGSTVEEEHYSSQLAINEMLARYGYAFKPEYGGSGKEAYDHFNGLAWYEQAKAYCPYGTADEVLYNCLNSTELANVDLICEWQKEHGCYY